MTNLLNIIDLEATCWEGDVPPGQVNEIIEIGVCVLNTGTLERTEKRSILVRPERSKVSEFCTRLTSLTPEMVAGGLSFAEACEVLRRDFHAEAARGPVGATMIASRCSSSADRAAFPTPSVHGTPTPRRSTLRRTALRDAPA